MPEYIIINAASGDDETLLGELLVYVSQHEALAVVEAMKSHDASDRHIRIYDESGRRLTLVQQDGVNSQTDFQAIGPVFEGFHGVLGEYLQRIEGAPDPATLSTYDLVRRIFLGQLAYRLPPASASFSSMNDGCLVPDGCMMPLIAAFVAAVSWLLGR